MVADETSRLGRFRHAVQRVVLLGSDAFEDHAGAVFAALETMTPAEKRQTAPA